nr:zinc finger BED domain-containing protein RICESLEEPER 2-like [Ipomoea batatas]
MTSPTPTPSVNYSGSATGINAEFDFDSEMPSSRQPEPKSPSIQEIEQPNSEERKPKRAKSTTSVVWKSFTKIGMVDGKERARCNGCQKEYTIGGIKYGTSSLLRHIPKCVVLPKYHNVGTMMGNRIKCTLWDEHVPAVMPFFNNHVDGHLIVLFQLCRAKTDDNEVRISSSYTATKVLFNLDCQEFADFRNSANNSQSPMVVSTIRDLYERAEAKMQVPIEFEQLRNKSMVFRINLKNEHIRNPAKPISVLSESESGDEAISLIVQANLKLKGVANDQDEVDTGAIKRCLLDQFSSSQNLKKCRPLVIKEEKTL